MIEGLQILFVVYGLLALSHILIQVIFSHSEYIRQSNKKFQSNHRGIRGKVTVIVPSYNEDPTTLKRCIESICRQKVDELEVFVIDDFSSNREELLEKVYRTFEHDVRVQIMLPKKNRGKRNCQKYGFDLATGDYIVTVDSDTLLEDPMAIHKLIQFFSEENIGAVTGDVRVENKSKNILTKLISYRYWSAFYQERAAQSRFEVMMCCSGPFSAYRKEIVQIVKQRYVKQKFLGEECTYGDDRHLTNLILEKGYSVVFNQNAYVSTYVPETISQYIKQQIRWNKSFYREMLWTIKFIRHHHWYMTYDLLMQFLLPILLVFSLICLLVETLVYRTPEFFENYLIVLVTIAFLRSLYGMYRTKDLGFLLFILYGFIHVLLLLPIRIFALCTLRSTNWGTR